MITTVPIKLTLIVLLAMSIASWAIGIEKFFKLKREQNTNAQFIEQFPGDLAELPDCSLSTALSFTPDFISLEHQPLIKEVLEKEIKQFDDKLEYLLAIVCTAPIVGVFGYVWSMFEASSCSPLAAKAGLLVLSISLLVTAPALFMYKLLVGRCKQLGNQLNGFLLHIFNYVNNSYS